jgi:hypothetical protein
MPSERKAPKRITSSRSRVKHTDVPLWFSWMRFTDNIVQDFDWWMAEFLKHTVDSNERFGDGSVEGLKWDIELVESNIEYMEHVCERLREACNLVNAIARQREQIRHMREDREGFTAFEVQQRQAKANELESGKLKQLEDALKEAMR